jgi:hypothetical protein
MALRSLAMSRQSPLGFAFTVVMEITAIVAIVSLLPRVDLRPPATPAAEKDVATASKNPRPTVDPTITPVGWTAPSDGNGVAPSRETSYYERRPSAPSLIEPDPARSQYVEQRLDRASQQLVNSVGSYVAQAGGSFGSYPPSRVPPPPGPSDSRTTTFAPATISPSIAPQPTATASSGPPSRRQSAGSSATQPRPWLRY